MDKETNKNLILALVLSLGVLIAWELFYGVPKMREQQARLEAEKQAQQQQATKNVHFVHVALVFQIFHFLQSISRKIGLLHQKANCESNYIGRFASRFKWRKRRAGDAELFALAADYLSSK